MPLCSCLIEHVLFKMVIGPWTSFLMQALAVAVLNHLNLYTSCQLYFSISQKFGFSFQRCDLLDVIAVAAWRNFVQILMMSPRT